MSALRRVAAVVAAGSVWLAAGVTAAPQPHRPGASSVARSASGADSTGADATRASLATRTLVDRLGRPLDGRGTTIAVIDTGVDPTHPAFALPGGESKIVRVLSALPCLRYGEEGPGTHEFSDDPSCVVDVPHGLTSDAGHGGHGTFVSGVAVGDHYTLPDGTKVGGTAPGARVLVISTTAALVGITNAFAWVLVHHLHPCGAGVPASVCPPIRAVNCSWGDNTAVIFKLQDRLARAGVLTVWANGNGGGDGSTSKSNYEATHDRTPGIISVAGYDDRGTGTRRGVVADTSSRGAKSDPTTWPDLVAPSVHIVSSCRTYNAICPAIETATPRNGPGPTDIATYFTGSGTSFAAPQVCAIVALLFQVRPQASAAAIERTLLRTAFPFGRGYRVIHGVRASFDKGAGLVDAYAAARALGARGR
ncbi:MAG: S8 family serine peptidase [Frankiales bacterium]|nr:S8 family serine peptidase [Frankiales bacterium]